jgi:hypothetical protein
MTATDAPAIHRAGAPSGRTAEMRACVCLTKAETFGACQALADADRVLVAAGTLREARALGDLFELLEDRMTRTGARPSRAGSDRPEGPGGEDRTLPASYDCSGSYSMDSELTQ